MTFFEAVTVISLLSSSAATITYAVISYNKSKAPKKDEIWETATRIITANASCEASADAFAETYETLKTFKCYGCSLHGETPIRRMVRTCQEKGIQPVAEPRKQTVYHRIQSAACKGFARLRGQSRKKSV